MIRIMSETDVTGSDYFCKENEEVREAYLDGEE